MFFVPEYVIYFDASKESLKQRKEPLVKLLYFLTFYPNLIF